jgi:hypothetical protein
MKLRIEGNVLRLRLKQNDLACLRDHGLVESAIRFGSGRVLSYSVVSAPEADEVSANYDGDAIRVVLPAELAIAWADSSHLAIEGPGSSDIRIVVEKDSHCVHKPGEAGLEQANPSF